MRSLNLDSLLGRRHQHATFHDAELQSLHLDFSSGSAKLQFLLPCGFLPSNELAYHCGTLEFSGLLFYFVEPSVFAPPTSDRLSLWITSDGPLPDQGVDLVVQLPNDLPEQAFAHYFYSSTTNSFIVFAAQEAAFHWQ